MQALRKRSDTQILDDIWEKINHLSAAHAEEIEVSVWAGNVTIQGAVRRTKDRLLLGDAVSAVEGVWNVKNEVHVTQAPPDPARRFASQPLERAQLGRRH
jgi:osmotically-inducible protein OsmY